MKLNASTWTDKGKVLMQMRSQRQQWSLRDQNLTNTYVLGCLFHCLPGKVECGLLVDY